MFIYMYGICISAHQFDAMLRVPTSASQEDIVEWTPSPIIAWAHRGL